MRYQSQPINQKAASDLILLCMRYRLAAGTIGRQIRGDASSTENANMNAVASNSDQQQIPGS